MSSPWVPHTLEALNKLLALDPVATDATVSVYVPVVRDWFVRHHVFTGHSEDILYTVDIYNRFLKWVSSTDPASFPNPVFAKEIGPYLSGAPHAKTAPFFNRTLMQIGLAVGTEGPDVTKAVKKEKGITHARASRTWGFVQVEDFEQSIQHIAFLRRNGFPLVKNDSSLNE
jgi:hypothetical protein